MFIFKRYKAFVRNKHKIYINVLKFVTIKLVTNVPFVPYEKI